MNILNKLDLLAAHAELIKIDIALLKKEMTKHEMRKKKDKKSSLDLVARAKAKRAKFRIP